MTTTRTAVITGGTGGIGEHTATALAKAGLRVLVTGRDKARGDAAVERIRKASGRDDAELVLGDLSSNAGIDALGDAILARAPKLDVLINNAGHFGMERADNADGFELHFAMNVVAPYRLTLKLKPALEAAAPSRVVNVTGGMPFWALDANDLQAKNSFVAFRTYSRSKRASDAMSLALARELAPSRVFLNIAGPGPASTTMTNTMTSAALPWYLKPMWPMLKRMMHARDDGASARKAAEPVIRVATTPELEEKSGVMLGPDGKASAFHGTVLKPENQSKVIDAILKR
ncbi:MAG: SDR family NAD(P)-dependent oxidoreductase [Archangium sp.]|nr:SDR family NAD(P)-dependent oxidoreductase [Archangium sp.]